MLKQLFIISLSILFIILSNISYAEKAQQIKGLIIVTSETLTADNKTNTALFENSVVARAEDMTIYADKMLVHYDKDTGNITKIEAEGEIKLIKGNRVITSREAIYYADGDKVIFIGEPRAVEGENVVTGRKMTYFLSEDRFLVEGSKVFLTRKKEQ
jgi:lipopolysaccharide export system protein LptA